MPQRIALFGGSFNPPHKGHEAILRWLMQSSRFDAVWVLPVVTHAFDKALVPYDDRAALVRVMLEELRLEVVGRPRLDLGGRPKLVVIRQDETYAVDTLRALHAKLPDHEFSLVVGEDCIADRSVWKEWDEVARLADIIVIARDGYCAEGFKVFNVGEEAGLSSTKIREHLARQDQDYLEAGLSYQVFQEIKRRKLYGLS